MFAKSSRRLALAALAATSVAAGAQAASPYVYEQSSPAWWGTAGSFAILEIYYDVAAKLNLTVTNPFVVDANGNGVSLLVTSCGTPVKTGDSVTGYTLAPGQSCYVKIARSPASVAGTVRLSDSTGKSGNIHAFVRGSVEIYDSSNNVLTHAELN